MKEIWKPIPGYKNLYEASNMGRVRRACKTLQKQKYSIVAQRLHNGYPICWLGKNKTRIRYKIHRLVLLAFVCPCPAGMEGSHLNDTKTDNRLVNLAWMTHGENLKLAFKNGRQPNKGMLGKHLSIEHSRKISEANRKRVKGNKNEYLHRRPFL